MHYLMYRRMEKADTHVDNTCCLIHLFFVHIKKYSNHCTVELLIFFRDQFGWISYRYTFSINYEFLHFTYRNS